MSQSPTVITSPQNPRIKDVVKLRKRGRRDDEGVLLVEGYRELRRALDNGWKPKELFYSPDLFLGTNEQALIADAIRAGAQSFECSPPVFTRMAYRDRPEGLLALGPQVQRALGDIPLSPVPLLVVAEAIEKPGNLGTILRSADAAAVDGLIVCDRCTDINNPNVVRSSTGALFSVPVAEASTAAVMTWLRKHDIAIVAATPHAEQIYTESDLRRPSAIVVGTEQYGLTERWMKEADVQVRIPMLGQADSLNVATATTLLLYEARRQRGWL